MMPRFPDRRRVARRLRPGRVQVPADQAADMLLNAARKAANEGNHAFAAGKFKEFVEKFGGHAQVQAARYGWGLSLLERRRSSTTRP